MRTKKTRAKRDPTSHEWLFEKYFEMKKRTLKKLSAETGYSLSRLKELSSKFKWKEKLQRKESEKDDKDYVTLIIPRCDGSIAQVLKKPILKKIKPTKDCPITKVKLGETKIVTDNVKHDEDGNVIISDSVRKFIKNKIAEQDLLREAMKKQKEEPVKEMKKQTDPFEAAVEKAMEVSKADKRFSKQARKEIRRWLNRFYSYDEATQKAISTLKCCQDQLKKEEKIKSEEATEIEKSRNGTLTTTELELGG